MNEVVNIKDYRYLIIGGTHKAGTTSIFYYLSDHPEVCASNRKETRFFLDTSYPGIAPYKFENGLDNYGIFFNRCSYDKLRVEATPEYLYSFSTPEKIKNALPHAKIVFILREPISRLISWYRFGKQIGLISADKSFDKYIEEQIKEGDKLKENLRTLKQGRYSLYLKTYFNVLGRDKILVLFYEEFLKNEKLALQQVSRFAEIDPIFYESYRFEKFNTSASMKSVKLHQEYIKFSRLLNISTLRHPKIYTAIRNIWIPIKPIYLRLNTSKNKALRISEATHSILKNCYKDEYEDLERLLKMKLPWRRI